MVTVDHISKAYGPQILFRDSNFSIGERARIGLFGPNGAGKSTFFRMLVGAEHPDEGEIRFPRNVRVGLMKQEWEPMEGDSVLSAALRENERWHRAKTRLHECEHLIGSASSEEHLLDYRKAEAEFSALGGYSLEFKAKEILSGLGFRSDDFEKPARALSGGWRIRCHLAGLLLGEPHLLLLDEPTNHLDIETVVWLEEFLLQYPHAVLLISHDRRLLGKIAEEILEFSPPKLTLWPGSLAKYESQKTFRISQLESEIANKEKEIARMQEFVDRFRAKATKARQAQNRLRSADHYREQVAQLKQEMPIVSKRASRFRLQPRQRLPRKVMEIESGVFGYDQQRPLFSFPHCLVEGGKKIGIIGPNGVGKSTFLKTCAGELPLLSGNFSRSEAVTVGYFAQHRMEQLPTDFTALEYLYGGAQDVPVETVRAVAGSLGLSGNDLEKPIDVLSGGERARVSLSRILLDRPGLLLLDEPTNHLDLEACDALVRGLSDYDGTVLVVSHDRDFLDSLVKYVLEIEPGRASLHHGSYTEWHDRRGVELASAPVAQNDASEPADAGRKKKSRDEKRKEAEERQRRYEKLRGVRETFREVEQHLEKLRTECKTLDETLAQAESPRDPQFPAWLKRRAQVGEELNHLESRWLELAEQMEGEKANG